MSGITSFSANFPLTITRYSYVMREALIHQRCRWLGSAIGRLLVVVLCMAFAQPAHSQTTSSFSNTTSGTVNGTTICSSPLVRNFTVASNFTVADVNIGILVAHTWRGDLQFTLQSPAGTRVQLTNGDTSSVSGDNFNVLLDDSASQIVNTDSATGNHANPSTFSPPYQNTFRPRSALSAFNGQSSAGTWRLEICDLFPAQDNGTFRRADLYLTSQPSNFADLSLSKVLVGSPPIQGGTATWELTVRNSSSSTQTADGIVVRDTFPGGFSLVSASGSGSFDAATRNWSVGSLAPGVLKTLTLTGTISSAAGTTINNIAEITASSVVDIDSTVNNGVTGEDDYASSSFVVQSGRSTGIPPVLSCPAGRSVFDWDTIPGWTAGSVDNSYAFSAFGNIRFQLGNNGSYVNNPVWGGQPPLVNNYYTGGLSVPQNSLLVVSDQSNQSGLVTITITLPRSFTGLQFSIFDVDFGSNQFADRVQVTGSNNGAAVTPTLTNGNVNSVSGNVAIGNGASDSDQGLGNVVVTFTQAVNSVTIRYGNHSTAPTNPGQQGVSIHDIAVCNPSATLSVAKVSSVISDPTNGSSNPKPIPGALVEYLITVSNSGPDAVDANSVIVWDDGPADAKMCLIGRAGGPIIFNDSGGSSGLTYTFASPGSLTDGLEFSDDDGANYNYTPVSDGSGCDTQITDFRVRPTGAFAAGGTFTITIQYMIE
ncbi:proprotein convertase P-domain-containing protein [Erythrobacter sp. GH1-10]|uniref:proprotein convertase P-domain-containing protein n=1 Tax=Erythrobacter sp. GH1-10 TaxID=3349334 RepID=UPI003877C6D8